MTTALAIRPTWEDAVRWVFPEVTSEEAGDILWNNTAYPFADRAYTLWQLCLLYTTIKNGHWPCELCNAPAIVRENGALWCDDCNLFMHKGTIH